MNRKQGWSLLLLTLIFQLVVGQNERFTISGYITDASTGEKLIGANVYDKRTYNGTSTNVYGFYSLTLDKDSVDLIVSYVGYNPKLVRIYHDKDQVMDFELNEAFDIEEVTVTATQTQKIHEKTQMSTVEIPMAQLRKIPALMGEVDIMKAMQLMPGVQSGNEGTAGLYVRGGGPDQNLILLDGAPVYNASHLFGFFSVFNADAINHVKLIKGGFPARYGGRLSSVLDISMKEGNTKKFQGDASIGLIASKLTLQGPLGSENTSFIVSGRRTYIDILAQPFIMAASEGSGTGGYYFYDGNIKINHKFSDKDRLYISMYSGKDKFYFREKWDGESVKANMGWGNLTGTARWNHLFSQKLFMNVMSTFSKYEFFTDISSEESDMNNEIYTWEFNSSSGIRDMALKVDFDYMPNPNHNIKFGANEIFHRFNSGVLQQKLTGGDVSQDTTYGADYRYAHEMSVYFEDDWEITPRLKMNMGLHASGFKLGNKFYPSLQPRVSARYLVTDKTALKGSYSQMQQYIHLLSNEGLGLPIDLWVPATERVKPQQAQQVAVGLAHTLEIKESEYELSVEGYFKEMTDVLGYKDGASFFFQTNNSWEDNVENGLGWSYGAELLLQKKTGKLTGWVGYTLSRSERQFDGQNNGEKFLYKFDRRHDISVVATYTINEKFDVAATWVYGTGTRYTLATSSQPIFNLDDALKWGVTHSFGNFGNSGVDVAGNFNEKNNVTMPDYHRLDLGMNYHKQKKRGEAVWSFGIYNVYNRRNPYFLYPTDKKKNGKRQAVMVSLVPIIPSFSYSFKF